MKSIAALAIAAIVVAFIPLAAEPQSWGDLKQKAKEKISSKPAAEQEEEQPQEEQEASEETKSAAAKPSPKPGEGAWANFDFVRGEKVLFADDFSKDRVGNFPRRLELDRGNMEVIEWEGQRFLRASDHSAFTVVLPQQLPTRFTIEFDLMQPWGDWGGMQVWTVTAEEDRANQDVGTLEKRGVVYFGPWGSGLVGVSNVDTPEIENQINHIRIAVDGDYMKAYVNEKRVVNVPRAHVQRSNQIQFNLFSNEELKALIGNIVVAAGGREMYDALMAEGRFSTQGILFDTGSDRIRPESTPTLTEIGEMLKEHADLKLTIEGHTDNVGDPAANKSLSDRRAAAVKEYLTKKHGIAAARLTTAGYGDTKPAVPNTTSEGRQQNRRVDLVKM